MKKSKPESMDLAMRAAVQRSLRAMKQGDYELSKAWLYLAFRASERLGGETPTQVDGG